MTSPAQTITLEKGKKPATKQGPSPNKNKKEASPVARYKKLGTSRGLQFYDGKCYLALFAHAYREHAFEVLGLWPSVKQILKYVGIDYDKYTTEMLSFIGVPYPSSDSLLCGIHIIPGTLWASEMLAMLDDDTRVGGTPFAQADMPDVTVAPPPVVPPPEGDNPQPDTPLPPGSLPVQPPNEPADQTPLPPAPAPLPAPIRTGDGYRPVDVQEEAADPGAAVETSGWLEYEPPTSHSSVSYGGLVTHMTENHNWVSSLEGIQASFPMYNKVRRHVLQNIKDTYTTTRNGVIWGMGPKSSASFMTQAHFTDNYDVHLWTTNLKYEVITVDNETILFDSQAGISVNENVTRVSNVFVGDGERYLSAEMGGYRREAASFMASVSTLAAAGRNNIAFLTIAYTRILAASMVEEQSLEPTVVFNSAGYNHNIIRYAGAANPISEAVLGYLRTRPNNLVLLPRGSSLSDEAAMMYLMGNGRIRGKLDDGNVVTTVFDRFVPSKSFKLAPIRGASSVVSAGGEIQAVHISRLALIDLLDRYVNENQLWDQMAIARNQALAMCFSSVFSSGFSLPQPSHTNDAQLQLVNTGDDYQPDRTVMDVRDCVVAIIISGTILCHAMVEVLFEGVLNTLEQGSGIGPRAPNFYATIDQRQDDFDLDQKLAIVTMPVVERFTAAKSSLPVEYCSPSNVNFIRSLAAGWEDRAFRVSSYLFTESTPSDRTLLVPFSETMRRQLGEKDFLTYRESIMARYLFTTPVGSQQSSVPYGLVYDANIDQAETKLGFTGQGGRHDYDLMTGTPTLWDFSVVPSLIAIKSIEPTEPDGEDGSAFGEDPEVQALIDRIMARQASEGSDDLYGLGPFSTGQHSDDDDGASAGCPDDGDGSGGEGPSSRPGPVAKGKEPAVEHKPGGKGYVGQQVANLDKISAKKQQPRRNRRSARDRELKTGGRKVRVDKVQGAKQPVVKAPVTQLKWPRTPDEAKGLDQLFPRGEDEHLKRAIYTIGNLLLELNGAGLPDNRRHDIEEFLYNGQGGKNAWAVGVAMYIATHQLSDPCYAYLKGLGLLTTGYASWADKWGSLNDVFRNMVDSESWQFTSGDFASCLYLAGLVGRPHREVDWDAEVAKRQAPDIPLRKYTPEGFVDMSDADTKNMIMEFLEAEGHIRIRKCQGFEEYYKERAQWMIKGSMGGERTVLDTEPEVRARLATEGFKVTHNTNKMHVAETVDYQWMRDVLDLEPIHLAKMHTKGQENAKIRSIQASLYSHYVFGSYWSKHLESTLTLKSATMNKRNYQLLEEAEVRRKFSERPDIVKVCLDYPDFGATHSCRQQYLVLECIYEFALKRGFQPTEDFVEIQDWYKRSFLNQWAMRPDNRTWFKCPTGMFSGVVNTTLFNTVLNGALRRHGIKTLSQMGTPVALLANYELGDDGWAAFPDREQAQAYIASIQLIGKQLNPLKQLVSRVGSEYLREWYMEGCVYGCPVRALAMVISGNVENNIASAGSTRIRELYESFSTLARRGLNRRMCQFFFEKLAIYEARRGALGRRRVLTYLYTSKQQGGLALYPIDSMPIISPTWTGGAYADSCVEVRGEEDMIASVLLESKIIKRFKASTDYVGRVEQHYSIAWKRDGKREAAAAIAASGIVGGAATTTLQHEQLEVAVLQAQWSAKEWGKYDSMLHKARRVRVGADEISKQYNKLTSEDRILMSEVGKISKIVRFMSLESERDLAQRMADREGISVAKVAGALRSLKGLKQEALQYTPSPFLSQELMGIYTQWKAVDKTSDGTALPGWLCGLATAYRT